MSILKMFMRWLKTEKIVSPQQSEPHNKKGLCRHLKNAAFFYGGHGRITYLGRVQNIETAHCGECARTWIRCEDAREWAVME